MNAGVVRDRKSLSKLLLEEDPATVAKNGDRYSFDRDVIRTLGAKLPEELHRQLRLPVLLYSTPDVPDSCSCPYESALAVLEILGEVSSLRTMEGSRFWLSRPLAYGLLSKYPTAFQVVMGA
jgi:hypothetical protein